MRPASPLISAPPMPLSPEDAQHLTAAQGYLTLGMHLEANAELEEIEPDVRRVPEVLEVRMEVYRALQKWDAVQVIARKLAQYDPNDVQWTVSWAYATRRAECLEAAKAILLEAVERLPNVSIFHYNLACYECQLGEIEVAKARLQHASSWTLRGGLRRWTMRICGRFGIRWGNEQQVERHFVPPSEC
jgi:lipopolysaccharide biosynthesis regulator YciM